MSVRREKDLSEHSAPSVPVAALKALEQQMRDRREAFRKACRIANGDGNTELDAYYDGKCVGIDDVLFDLTTLIAHAEER